MLNSLFRIIATLFISLLLAACAQTDGMSILKQNCTRCHNLVPICSKLGQKGLEDWKVTIESMKKAGAKVSTSDAERLSEFLARQNRATADFCK